MAFVIREIQIPVSKYSYEEGKNRRVRSSFKYVDKHYDDRNDNVSAWCTTKAKIRP